MFPCLQICVNSFQVSVNSFLESPESLLLYNWALNISESAKGRPLSFKVENIVKAVSGVSHSIGRIIQFCKIVTHNSFHCKGKFSAYSSHCVDRKSTRLNSSHVRISYAVFC